MSEFKVGDYVTVKPNRVEGVLKPNTIYRVRKSYDISGAPAVRLEGQPDSLGWFNSRFINLGLDIPELIKIIHGID